MPLQWIWKRLITKEVPLLSQPLYIAVSSLPRLAFNAKPNIKFTHFCTQTAAPSATLPDSGVLTKEVPLLSQPLYIAVSSLPGLAFNAKPNIKFTRFCNQTAVLTEFLLNKCGFTDNDITRAFKHRDALLGKSIQNLEQVLELLHGCGVSTPAQIRSVVLGNPRVFFYKSETKVKNVFNFLRAFMKKEDVSKLICNYPTIFNVSEHKINSAVSLLEKLGVEGEFLSFLLARQPRLLSVREEKVIESFKLAEDLGVKKGSKTFASAMRMLLGVGKETIDRRLQFLRSLGFSEKEIMEISSKKPLILGCTEDNLKSHVDFVVNSVGLPLSDFVVNSALFTYSLEKRMIPRYRVMEALKCKRVLKTEIGWPWVFIMSERRFLEKYVNSNAEYSTLLQDIYHGRKAEKLVMDKETWSVSQ